jgi:arylsulfatase A-like enzyme
VRLIDVMPTVLDFFALPLPSIDGVSLFELMTTGRGPELEAYSESEYPRRFGCSPLRALRDARFKLIDGPRPELYDLERDPFELRNVYDDRRQTAEALRRRLETIARRRRGSEQSEGSSAAAGSDLHERLRSLGYVSNGRGRALPHGSLDDTLPARCDLTQAIR